MDQQELVKRFEAIDKRFEAIELRLEAMEQRFNEVLQLMGIQYRFAAVPIALQGEACSVCLDLLVHGDVVKTHCDHYFHSTCIRGAYIPMVRWPCPLCRDSLMPQRPSTPSCASKLNSPRTSSSRTYSRFAWCFGRLQLWRSSWW